VDKLRVCADRNNVAAHLYKAVMLVCQNSKFGGSNKGEIGGTKEQDRPSLPADLVDQPEVGEFVVGGA
jgi:hypothetical protein